MIKISITITEITPRNFRAGLGSGFATSGPKSSKDPDSGRVGLGPFSVPTHQKRYKKLLISSLKCVANTGIYRVLIY